MGAFEAEPLVDVSDEAANENLERQYRWSVQFVKDKDGKAFHMAYEKRVRMAALSKQVSRGPFDQAASDSDVGFLDRFGHDRNESWRLLGRMDRREAMRLFIKELEQQCPEVAIFYQAELSQIAAARQDEQSDSPASAHIREALNRDNYEQFSRYAIQQHPDDPNGQRALIKQLQDKHFEEYMLQLNSNKKIFSRHEEVTEQPVVNNNTNEADDKEEHMMIAIEPASMWTRRDIDEFKEAIRDEENGVIKIGPSETVTVRVPTHENGSCLFWEFATDAYDIAFGLYFEWTVSETSAVSVHVGESDDEEYEEDEAEEQARASNAVDGDLEKGCSVGQGVEKPHVDQIVPIFRRDCHEEVFAGSHVYPGSGVYLLKFDNSYSMWRSKTLYYRVYYSK